MLKRRLLDLANTAYMRGIAVYSDFLNLWELNIYHSAAEEFPPLRREAFGGYEYAERQMVALMLFLLMGRRRLPSLSAAWPSAR